MPGVLPAEHCPVSLHLLQNLTVSHRGCSVLDAQLRHRQAQAQVRHHGRDHPVAWKPALPLEGFSAHGNDLVTGHHGTGVIHHHEPVCIAIQGQSQRSIVLGDDGGQLLGMLRAAAVVDVASIGGGADGDKVGPEVFQQLGADPIGGAVGAIQNQLHAVQDRSVAL